MATTPKTSPAIQTALQVAAIRRMVRDGEVRRIREMAQLTQREVARAVGVTCATVADWEKGRHFPNGRTAIEYARLLSAILGLYGGGNDQAL